MLTFGHSGAQSCQKNKNGGLDQYGCKHFDVKSSGITGLERVKHTQTAVITVISQFYLISLALISKEICWSGIFDRRQHLQDICPTYLNRDGR